MTGDDQKPYDHIPLHCPRCDGTYWTVFKRDCNYAYFVCHICGYEFSIRRSEPPGHS